MLTASAPASLSQSPKLWLIEFGDRSIWELPQYLVDRTQIITLQAARSAISCLADSASAPELLLLSSNSWNEEVATFWQQLSSSKVTFPLPPALLLYDSSQQLHLELALAEGIYDCIDIALPESLLLQRLHNASQYHRLLQQAQTWTEQEQQFKAQLGRVKTRLELLRRQDEITQLLNRLAFEESLQLVWRLHLREQKELCLVLLELGYESMDWDEVPHSISTQYLREVGTIVLEQLKRPGDVACRYREKQIMLLLPNTTYEGALNLLRSLDASLHLELEATPSFSSALTPAWQCGVASAKPLPGDSVALLIAKVQQALVVAKDQQLPTSSASLH